MPSRSAHLLALASSAALLGACAGSGRPVHLEPSQPAGGTWEAVLPGPTIAGLLEGREGPAWALERRDGSLGPRPPEPVLATAEWPDPERPSLDHPRYVRIVRSPEVFLFYRTEEHIGHRHYRWR